MPRCVVVQEAADVVGRSCLVLCDHKLGAAGLNTSRPRSLSAIYTDLALAAVRMCSSQHVCDMYCLQVLAFPVQMLVRFWVNHHLLDLIQRPCWRVVKGRSKSYVDKVLAGRKHDWHSAHLLVQMSVCLQPAAAVCGQGVIAACASCQCCERFQHCWARRIMHVLKVIPSSDPLSPALPLTPQHSPTRTELPDVRTGTPIASIARDSKKQNVTVVSASGQKMT